MVFARANASQALRSAAFSWTLLAATLTGVLDGVLGGVFVGGSFVVAPADPYWPVIAWFGAIWLLWAGACFGAALWLWKRRHGAHPPSAALGIVLARSAWHVTWISPALSGYSEPPMGVPGRGVPAREALVHAVILTAILLLSPAVILLAARSLRLFREMRETW